MKKILVTGGTGYIGAHIVVELINAGYDITIIDNLINSKEKVIDRIKKITGLTPSFIQCDICNTELLNKIFVSNNFDSVVHLAGLKSVDKSIENPLEYYNNNVQGSINLFKVMKANNVKNIIFSSSATVYGDPSTLPIKETMPTGNPSSPYGTTKLMIEKILEHLYLSDDSWRIGILRYFNPIGAHESGLIGEDPNSVPSNLMPYICQTAIGHLDKLFIYGNDYKTIDGTAVRDYIHVTDLASGHLKALENLKNHSFFTINLGTGIGFSVLQVVNTFSEASGIKIPYEFASRRSGDIESSYTDVTLANNLLGWSAQKGLMQMCADAWNWQKLNPDGYK